MEFNWNVGDVHPDQSRWQANLALGLYQQYCAVNVCGCGYKSQSR
jgi:hypothetical protein